VRLICRVEAVLVKRGKVGTSDKFESSQKEEASKRWGKSRGGRAQNKKTRGFKRGWGKLHSMQHGKQESCTGSGPRGDKEGKSIISTGCHLPGKDKLAINNQSPLRGRRLWRDIRLCSRSEEEGRRKEQILLNQEIL